MRFACAVLLTLAASAGSSAGVFSTLSMRDNPDGATLLSSSATLSNSINVYGLSLSNKRAHGNDGRRFRMGLDNGLKSGFSGLVENVAIFVNGIPARVLQLRKDTLRKWSGPDGAEGVEFKLNFDGARVDVRFWMCPVSPVLFGEVAKSEDGVQFTPVTNVVVKITAIPSYLDCGQGRKTRFYRYARQVQTASRLLGLPPGRSEKIHPDDLYFILQDGEYDGSAEGKGCGPSATWPLAPTSGRIILNDSWTTSVEYTPDLSRPFRFALLEYGSVRMSNDDFKVKYSAKPKNKAKEREK